jgi:hypothetical protein
LAPPQGPLILLICTHLLELLFSLSNINQLCFYTCTISEANMTFVISVLDLDFISAFVYSLQYYLFLVMESFIFRWAISGPSWHLVLFCLCQFCLVSNCNLWAGQIPCMVWTVTCWIWGVCGGVVNVIDFKPLVPHHCGLESRQLNPIKQTC